VDRKKLIIAGAALALLLGTGLFFILRGRGEKSNLTVNEGTEENSRRDNMLFLASDYANKGEFAMALDLINDLLLDDPQDPEARALRDSILQARREAEEASKQADLDALKEQNQELSKGLQELSTTLQNQNRESAADKAARQAAEEDARRKQLLKEQQVADLVDQARDALNDKEYDKAISLAKQALSVDPSSYDAQSIKREAEEAKRAAESAAERKAREEEEKTIAHLLDDADKALDQDDYAEVRKLIDQVLELDPDNGRAHSLQGQSWYDENPDSAVNRNKAENSLTKALEEDPEDWETYFYLGKVAEKEDNDLEAIENYLKAAGLNGTSPELYYTLGILQYRNKLYKEALSSFKRVEVLNSAYEGNYFTMGMSQSKLGDKQSALASFLQSCQLSPDHGASFYEAGKAFNSLGNQGQAIHYLTQAIQIKEDPRYLRYLGSIYYITDDYMNAISRFQRSLELDPNRADAMNNIAICYISLGDYSSSLSWSTKAVQKEPANEIYLFTMGQAAEGVGMTDQAVEIYKKSAALDSSYASPRLNLGNILDSRGEYVNALQNLQEAYRAEPDNVSVWNSLGTVFLHMEQYESSIKWYEKAVAGEPKDPLIKYNLALGYIAVEENEKAVVQLTNIIKIDSNYWDAYFHLANVYFAMGDKDKAREVAEELIGKNPDYDKKDQLNPIFS
jgi:tetratricopeptide (TPR) repeat protein